MTIRLYMLILVASITAIGCLVPLAQPKEQRIQYVEREHPEAEIAKAIRLGKVVPGMSREQVEASWGPPSSVDSTEAIGLNLEWGKEVWEYESDGFFIMHPEATVFFNNGKVTEVSPSYLSDLEYGSPTE